MKNWSSVALGDIFDIARGGSPRPIQSFITSDSDGINWIMIGDASDNSRYITSTKKRIIKSGVSKSRMVNPGDFLLTNSMSFGHPYILKTSGCIHDGWLVLSAKQNNIDQNYFYHLLGSNAVYREFSRRAAGTTVKNLNIDLVRGVKVSLPPLEEQKRIAAILDKADAIRRKRKEAIALTEELLRSTFLDMFGDPVTNPKGWKVEPLAKVVFNHDSKRIPLKESVRDKRHGCYPYYGSVGIIDYVDNFLFDGEYLLISEDGKHLESRNRPICCIANGKFWVNNHAHVLSEKEVDIYFLSFFMELNQIRSFVTGIDQFKLNRSNLERIPVFIPPIPLQKQFRDIYHRNQSLLHKISTNTEHDLFNSLLQKAFRGEL